MAVFIIVIIDINTDLVLSFDFQILFFNFHYFFLIN